VFAVVPFFRKRERVRGILQLMMVWTQWIMNDEEEGLEKTLELRLVLLLVIAYS